MRAATGRLSFIVVFGCHQGAHELSSRAGSADRIGRKHVLVAGWLIAMPVPFI